MENDIITFTTWELIWSNEGVQFAFIEFEEAVFENYKTLAGQYRMLTDVREFLHSSCVGPVNPHVWDKLLSRARNHGCNRELRELRCKFDACRNTIQTPKGDYDAK